MKTLALLVAASWLAIGPVAKAGELDSEYGGKAKAITSAPSLGKAPGELDNEAPTQAWFHGRRFYGYGGFGYGGFGFGYPFFGLGYGGYGYGYPFFGGYGYGRGFGGFGYGRGFGGYGYRGFGGYGHGFGGFHGGHR
jgi:hypothetical protein